MCPMVPTLTCGLDRSNFSFAMSFIPSSIASLLTLRPSTPSSSAFAPSALRRDSLHSLACRDEARRRSQRAKSGADDRDRTGDLVLTKDALCQLSYIGLRPSGYGRQVGLAFTTSPLRRGRPELHRRRPTSPATIPRPPCGEPCAFDSLPLGVRTFDVSCSACQPKRGRQAESKAGAGDGDRTRDQQLGRL